MDRKALENRTPEVPLQAETLDVVPDTQTRAVERPSLAVIGRMAGEYRLLAKLGEGGGGAVYAAEHPLLKRRAAVKVLHRVPMAGSKTLSRFVAEAQAVHRIRCQHIVDIFSFGQLDDGRPFYVMDLLEGEPLDRYLARLGRLSVSTVLQILRPVSQALELAHAAGIVHRDVKPQNIFLALEPSGETVPKLLDFGIAKLTEGALTVSGAVLGTPFYMSPEQARGADVDARSDVYALGVLVYELLTGRVPFEADTAVGVAMAHLTLTPTRPSAVCSGVPEVLDEPILRMLEKSPDARPASVCEAFAALVSAAERAGFELPATLCDLPPLVSAAAPLRLLQTTVGDSGVVPVAHSRVRAAAVESGPAMARQGGLFASVIGAALVVLAMLAYRSFALPASAPRPAPVSTPELAQPAAFTESEPSLPSSISLHTEPAQPIEPARPIELAQPPPHTAPLLVLRKRKVSAPARGLVPRDLEDPF